MKRRRSKEGITSQKKIRKLFFSRYNFKVSNANEDSEEIEKIIKKYGGKCSTENSLKDVDFFVHSYNVEVEDGEMLKLAHELKVSIVSTSYIRYCEDIQMLVDCELFMEHGFIEKAKLLETMNKKDKGFSSFFPPHEWVTEIEGNPQCFEDFKNMERYDITSNKKNILFIPLCPKNSSNSMKKFLVAVKEFIEIYFLGMKVEISHPIHLECNKNTANLNDGEYLYPISSSFLKMSKEEKKSNLPILEVMDILKVLKEKISEEDGNYCVLGFVWNELYEESEDNIILGRGTGDRVGCMSFNQNIDSISDVEKWVSQNQTFFGTNTHEILHMLGIDHCEKYQCVMNAYIDDDYSTNFVCPIDLKKLEFVLKFNVKERYERFILFCKKYGWNRELVWLEKRIEHL